MDAQIQAAALHDEDWLELRRVLAAYGPQLLPVIDRDPATWLKSEVAEMGFVILQAVVAEGVDDDVVSPHGEDLEALFSRLPQY